MSPAEAVRWLAGVPAYINILRLKPPSRRFSDRQDGWMTQPPLHRNGAETYAYLMRPSQLAYVVLPHLGLIRRVRDRDYAGTRLAKGSHQCAVVELADDCGLDVLAFEPAQQRHAQRAVFARNQERHAVQVGRKRRPQRVAYAPCSHEGDAAIAQRMALALVIQQSLL